MKDAIEEQVIAAVAKAKNLTPESIGLDSTFEELGVDSLDAIELLFELEDVYQVAIPDDDAKQFATVGEVVAALRQVLPRGPEAPAPGAP